MFLGVISKYFEEGKDFEAYGILHNLYKLGPSVSFLPLQIEYYAVLMKTDRGEEADGLVEKIFGVVKERLRVDIKTCKRLAQRYFDEKKYFKSILFAFVGNHLIPDEKDNMKKIIGIGKNTIRLNEGIKKARKESYSYRKLMRLWVLPRVRRTLEFAFHCAGGYSQRALTLMNVACMHGLEIAEGYVDDFDGVEITLTSAIDKLRALLGHQAQKTRMLGVLLNNLAGNNLIQKRPLVARIYLIESISATQNAEDYESEEEKIKVVEFTNRVLRIVEEILKHQEI